MPLISKHTAGVWFTPAFLVYWCGSSGQSSFPEGFHNSLHVLTMVFFLYFVKEKKKKIFFLNRTFNRSVEVFQPNRGYGQCICLLCITKNKHRVLTKQIEYGCFLWGKKEKKVKICIALKHLKLGTWILLISFDCFYPQSVRCLFTT